MLTEEQRADSLEHGFDMPHGGKSFDRGDEAIAFALTRDLPERVVRIYDVSDRMRLIDIISLETISAYEIVESIP